MRVKSLITLLLAFIVSGCSVFKSSRAIDMSPFSDNAGTLFGEAVKIGRPFQWKHLKEYTSSIPEFVFIIKRAEPLLIALQGIVYYSNQVVAINNSKLSNRDKNKQLARYLSDAMEKALKNQKVDSLQLDRMGAGTVLENIRNAETYLDGIAAASPIVNSVVSAIKRRLDEIQEKIPFILIGFDRKIERDYAVSRTNYERLHDLQEKLMLSTTRLYLARIGDRAELDTLLQEDPSITYFIPSAAKASPAQLAAAATYLLDQLRQIDTLIHQMDVAKAEYVAKQDELIIWRTQVDEKIMIARTAITVWAQSHRNLGAGIPVPPLFDVTGFASGLIGSATKTVIP
jgi:hypothetical protein